jgi:xylulokinase
LPKKRQGHFGDCNVDVCLIGIDVGTTATKATMIDGAGRQLASFTHAHQTRRGAPGQAEQVPEDWMEGVLGALAAFAEHPQFGTVAGIGICSQVNTHVFVGEDGLAVRPAFTWQDTRADPDARRLDSQVSAEDKSTWFGGPIPIDASHALSRMAYVARTDPEAWAATRHVLLPKDYCIFRLTSAVVADPIAAVGLVGQDGTYVAPLLDLVPGAAGKLPPLFAFHHVAGRVSPGLPGAGLPVVVGAMDAWGGMFGCGVVGEGEAMYQSGTSEIPGIVSSRIVPTPGVILFPPYDGIVMHAAPTQSGGAALAWLGKLLGRTPAELSTLAAQSRPDAVPLFLPHLAGERAPIWDADTRGVFARIETETGAPELARAVMEGVAFSARWAFDALKASAAVTPRTIRISGGGSRSDIWCQIRADVLGLPLERTAVPDAAALGAAILAGIGSGAMPALEPAVRQLVRYDRTFEPDRDRADAHAERFDAFKALYGTLKPFNARYAVA